MTRHPGAPPHLTGSARKILVLLPGGLPEAVLARDLLLALRLRHPQATLHAVVPESHAGAILPHRLVEGIIPIPEGLTFDMLRQSWWGAKGLTRLLATLRHAWFDLALAPSPHRDDLTDLAMLASEAPLRIAWETPQPRGENATDGEGWDAFYTHLISLKDAPYPEPERYQHVVKVLGLDPGEPGPSWPPMLETARAVARRFATARKGASAWIGLWCAPGDATGFQRWREALPPLLRQTPGLGLVLLGSGGWRALPGNSSAWQGLPILDLRGQLPAAEQLETVAACKAVVGTEGPWVHLCEARSVPHVVLLGGGSFARRAPLSPLATAVCRPLACYFCDWACDQDARHCLGDIPPEAVTEAVRISLSHVASKPRLMICPASPDHLPPPLDLEPLLAPGACERIPAPGPAD